MEPILLDLPESIHTARLILRPSQPGDGAGLFRAMMDGYENQIKWLGRNPTPPTLEEMEKEARLHAADWITRSYLRFIIVKKENNQIVGRAAFPPPLSDWRVPYFGISYFVALSESKKGIASETVNALSRFAFKVLGARKIEIKCDSENISSFRVPEKCGFQIEAETKGNWPRTDIKELATIKHYALFDPNALPPLEVNW